MTEDDDLRTLDEVHTLVETKLHEGYDPNDIQTYIQDALDVLAPPLGWCQFGDGLWRRDTVCSICGSWAAGVCGHRDDPNRKIIRRIDYERQRRAAQKKELL